jgi:hypothetical protein
MGQLATDLYQRFVERDGGLGVDFSGVLPWISNQEREG